MNGKENFLHSTPEEPVFFISVYIPYEIIDRIDYTNREYHWGLGQERPYEDEFPLPEGNKSDDCDLEEDDEDDDGDDEQWLPPFIL